MAERVQADLESMLTELEQIQRVGLLSPEETKLVIKKRKHFEYKLQKQSKTKEDILCYIQYESSLLDLIEMRRDKLGYLHKKSEIDGAISRRINQLFRIAEHRFGQTDSKLWITHLAFLKRMDWKAESGKVLRRFLQALSHQEEAWIFAARFQEDFGLARTLLLEGLRFHPKSIELYREYFMLELEFLKKGGEEIEGDKEEVLNGKLVQIVFEEVLDKVNETIFVSELLGLALKSNIPKLSSKLKQSLKEKKGNEPWIYIILASMELVPNENDPKNTAQKMENCSEVLMEALETLKNEEILEESVEFLQKISEKYPEQQSKCEEIVVDILRKGQNLKILNEGQASVLSELPIK